MRQRPGEHRHCHHWPSLGGGDRLRWGPLVSMGEARTSPTPQALPAEGTLNPGSHFLLRLPTLLLGFHTVLHMRGPGDSRPVFAFTSENWRPPSHFSDLPTPTLQLAVFRSSGAERREPVWRSRLCSPALHHCSGLEHFYVLPEPQCPHVYDGITKKAALVARGLRIP